MNLNKLNEEEAKSAILNACEIPPDGFNRRIQRVIPQEYKSLFLEVESDIDIESVILSDDNIDKINSFLGEFKYRSRINALGLKAMNKLMFYGASGCGKTYLAKALSNKVGYTMLCVDIGEALKAGTVMDNLKQVFEISRDGGYLIFLDECDNIAWTRDDAKGNEESVRVVESLFQMIDTMNPNNILVCATNLLHKIDTAFKRRFNKELRFELPKTDINSVITRFVHNGFEILDDIDEGSEKQIKKHCNLSYAELKDITESGMKRAVMQGTNVLKLSDIYRDIASTFRTKISIEVVE